MDTVRVKDHNLLGDKGKDEKKRSKLTWISKETLWFDVFLFGRSWGRGGILGGFSCDRDATNADASDIDLKFKLIFHLKWVI